MPGEAGIARPYEGADSDVAIIGLVCRLPGAHTPDQFWHNLCAGVESITTLSDASLRAAGVAPALLADAQYVKAAAIIDDIDQFDAAFFGYSPREAAFMDPQQRIFLECAWEALEDAGYNPETYRGSIGVFGGAKTSAYLFNLFSNRAIIAAPDITEIGLGNDLANLTTRISYKCNLRGPSYALHTACSTSLVAVHLACQSLLINECQIALAGGIALNIPQNAGYLYQHGGILSPDGHCRAFDAAAQGTIFGSGVGIVVLKRMEDALADGDTIHAIIKGSASNNDGALKASFTAPGVDGQAQVIAEALAAADVHPETIAYVEAHGTGTLLGDSIEIRALTKAFQGQTQQRHFCAIGSVKTNIGHLDTAAGISSLIKTILALKHKKIPPSLYFERPSPLIDFEQSPFYVSTQLAEWPRNGAPRRAGVSSFGFGSTNAHVILEEAPVVEPEAAARPWHLLLLSARSEPALEAATGNLVQYLKQNPSCNLADVAYTLQVGRKTFDHGRIALCQTIDEAIHALETADPQRVFSSTREMRRRPVTMMFTGQGSQYPDMGRELYQTEPIFQECVDRCAELLLPHLGLDLRDILYPDDRRPTTEDRRSRIEDSSLNVFGKRSSILYPPSSSGGGGQWSVVGGQELEQTWLAQPALFVIEYALAQLWMAWGVAPQALIGHSIGELVAACLADVFSLEDALALVAARGRLMQSVAPGAMLAVPFDEPATTALLEGDLALAAVNSPGMCVVSGPSAALAALHERLAVQGITCRPLHTSHAFHSAMMDAVLEAFTERVARVALRQPRIPFISNVTGTWITAEEAIDPHYWGRQLRQTVRFSDGLQELLRAAERVLLEVGPGQILGTFARQHQNQLAGQVILTSLPHARQQQSDLAAVLTTLGRLWLAGVEIDWPALYTDERRQRIALPTYPFERQRYWIDPDADVFSAAPAAPGKQQDIGDWFYLPSWKRSLLPTPLQWEPERRRCWLVFGDADRLSAGIIQRLRRLGQDVICVTAGTQFRQIDPGNYTLNPALAEGYSTLLQELRKAEKLPDRIIHLWSVAPNEQPLAGVAMFDWAQARGFSSLLFLAQALGKGDLPPALSIGVVSSQLHEVTGSEAISPEKATLLGMCRVIPQEYPQISCRSIDIDIPGSEAQQDMLIDHILADVETETGDMVIAYRGHHCWVQTFEPVRLEDGAGYQARLREQGVYLITGGLGGVGLVLAEYLAQTVRARLILVGRSVLPPRETWDRWLETHDANDTVAQKIQRVRALEALGAEVLLLNADVINLEQMRSVLDQGIARFGAIHGVFHAAGVAGGGLIQLKTAEQAEQVLAPKTRGVLVLETLLKDRPLDFLLLFSSLSAIVGEFGQADYCAANAFLDAYAQWAAPRHRRATIAVNWDTWQDIGMAIESAVPPELRRIREQVIAAGINPAEGMAALRRILAQGGPAQVAVSTQALQPRIAHIYALTRRLMAEALGQTAQAGPAHPRPELQTLYVAPRNGVERVVADIWQQILGIESVGINDDFFELGGHSLLITQLLNKLHKIYPVELSIRTLFERPTVASMAQLIEQASGQSPGDQQPLDARIKAAPLEERIGLLETYWRQKVAQALSIPEEQLPTDGDLSQVDLPAITSDLMWNCHQDFHLQVYPHEIRRQRSIGELARFVAHEQERLAGFKQNERTVASTLYDDYEALIARERPAHFHTPPKKNPPVVFLHSSPRAGSTLMRVMLAGHPDLFCPPELDILRCETIRDWLRGMNDATIGYGFFWAVQGLQWAFIELMGLDDDAIKAFLNELQAQNVPIYDIYARLQKLAAPRLLVDKSPQYSLRPETLWRAETLFESPKYIHLIRHPYAVIESLVRVRLDRLFALGLYGTEQVDSHVVAEKVWVTCNRNLLDFSRQIDSERYHLVRYEELVSDPTRVMRGVCDFLEVPFNTAVLQPYDNRPQRMISGLGDPNILRHDAVDARLGETWQSIRLPYRLSEPARQLAAELQYMLPAEDAPAPPLPELLLESSNLEQLERLMQRVEQMSPAEVELMLQQISR